MCRLALSIIAAIFAINVAYSSPAYAPYPAQAVGTGSTPTTLDPATLTGGGSLSGGNLTYSSTGSASVVRSTRFATTKFYLEVTLTAGVSGSGNFALGGIDSTQGTATPTSIATVTNKMWLNRNDSLALSNGSSSAYGSNYGTGSVMSIAVDNTLGSGSGKIWVGQCSGGTITWPSSGNPATGANAMFSNLTGSIGLFFNTQSSATFTMTANFGATAYSCTAPSGYGNL